MTKPNTTPMRQIKFRAWDTSFGEPRMVSYEDLLLYDNLKPSSLVIPLRYGDNFTLMQFTGTKDKKGKEIYEGDVITHSNDGMIGVVTWSVGLYRFVIENLEQTEIIADLCDYDFEPEVLGNIYKNKDLL